MSKTINVYDWADGSNHKIKIERFDGHYIIRVDGAFWCTSEMFPDVYSEITEIMKLYDWKVAPMF